MCIHMCKLKLEPRRKLFPSGGVYIMSTRAKTVGKNNSSTDSTFKFAYILLYPFMCIWKQCKVYLWDQCF